jgi:hypothetical protein
MREEGVLRNCEGSATTGLAFEGLLWVPRAAFTGEGMEGAAGGGLAAATSAAPTDRDALAARGARGFPGLLAREGRSAKASASAAA